MADVFDLVMRDAKLRSRGYWRGELARIEFSDGVILRENPYPSLENGLNQLLVF